MGMVPDLLTHAKPYPSQVTQGLSGMRDGARVEGENEGRKEEKTVHRVQCSQPWNRVAETHGLPCDGMVLCMGQPIWHHYPNCNTHVAKPTVLPIP